MKDFLKYVFKTSLKTKVDDWRAYSELDRHVKRSYYKMVIQKNKLTYVVHPDSRKGTDVKICVLHQMRVDPISNEESLYEAFCENFDIAENTCKQNKCQFWLQNKEYCVARARYQEYKQKYSNFWQTRFAKVK